MRPEPKTRVSDARPPGKRDAVHAAEMRAGGAYARAAVSLTAMDEVEIQSGSQGSERGLPEEREFRASAQPAAPPVDPVTVCHAAAVLVSVCHKCTMTWR
jgi:hypothetical protein